MQRITGADVAEDLFGPGKDGFTEGSPGIEAATVVTAQYLNQVQEELVAGLIEHAGLTPGPATTQVREAIAANDWVFTGDCEFTAPLHVENLNSDHTLTVGAGDIRCSNDFEYCDATGAPVKKSKVFQVPLSSNTPDWSRFGGELVCKKAFPAEPIEIPLPVHHESHVDMVRVAFVNAAAGSAPQFTVYRKVAAVGAAMSLNPVASDTTPGGVPGSTAAGGQVMSTGNTWVGPSVFGPTEEWHVRIAGFNENDKIVWIELTVDDPGPRNF